MTLTVQIKFKTDIPTDSVFRIVQSIVRTPDGIEPVRNTIRSSITDYYANPPGIGADCLMSTYKENNFTVVELDIPYISAHKMHGNVYSVIHNLRIKEYAVYNEFTGEWHQNEFSFLDPDQPLITAK